METDYDDVPTISAADLTAHFDKKDAKDAETKRKQGRPKGTTMAAGAKSPAAGGQLRQAAQVASAVKVSTHQRKLVTADTYAAIAAKYGDPLEALAEIAFETEEGDDGKVYYKNSVDVRLSALKELVPYGHAKLKTIEHTGANGEPLEFKQTIVQNILQMINPNVNPEPRTITESEQ